MLSKKITLRSKYGKIGYRSSNHHTLASLCKKIKGEIIVGYNPNT
jgi:hypothetical protein